MALSKILPAGQEVQAVGKSLIINGAMQVSQRGDSTSATTTKYVCDRTQVGFSSAGTWDITQSSTSPDGFANSLKIDCTAANTSLSASSFMLIRQKIESQNLQHIAKGTSSAKKLTLSFHIRSNKTGTYQVNLRDGENARLIGATYSISSADTWEKKEITFAADTSGTLPDTNVEGIAVEWWFASGSNYAGGAVPSAWESSANTDRNAGSSINLADSTSNELYITGVQLEVGETATPFEHRSYADELRRCQRYFAKIRAGWSGDTTNNGSYRASYQNAVEMRATPTATWTNISQAGFDAAHNSEQITTYGGGVYRQCNTTSDGRLYWSDATLDAEL
jgi:hypothetical protein